MSEETKSELHTIIVGFARRDTFERIFQAFLSLASLVFTKGQVWDQRANHWDSVRPMFCTIAGAKPATCTVHGRGGMRTWGCAHNVLWQVTISMGMPSAYCAQEQAKQAPHGPNNFESRYWIVSIKTSGANHTNWQPIMCATSQLSIADCRSQTHANWKGAVTFFSPGRLAK